MYENNIGWLDLPNMEAKLPTFKDKIIIKASRINWKSVSSSFPTKTK